MRIRALCGAAVIAAAFFALPAAAVAHTATPAPRLLAKYQPVVELDALESFAPTKVQSFLADADLERLDAAGTWTVVDADPDAGELPSPGTGVWRLNQDSCTPAAPLGGLACYAARWNEGHGAPVVYGRIARQADRIVLQYWYFYYANTYSYLYPPSDFVWQAHEGDWEVVNVVLSEDEEPLSVGYSQHCLGERRSWDDTPRMHGSHPVVYVAIGSHANYFTAGVHAWDPRCIPAQAIALLGQFGLPLPVDYAFGGRPAGAFRQRGVVMPIRKIGDDRPAWVSFPGFWGELQYLHAPSPVGTVPFGTAPVGPAFHAVWVDPLGTLATWTAR